MNPVPLYDERLTSDSDPNCHDMTTPNCCVFGSSKGCDASQCFYAIRGMLLINFSYPGARYKPHFPANRCTETWISIGSCLRKILFRALSVGETCTVGGHNPS